ncbi:uncharacterized protein MKK02DRAFT_45814 [Dioszegia hungarica]|uniref:Uncharacterized protein n=1 Tax=Dioszegia hungarica TaxID=4972 RepID=A0AA38H9Z4_9TREE|nr:uncharacterized protein MKK02DRAFT_45814 [Dioszegia hungarica]KAI9637103.1 hypothetical protein MKK02DRAFT_45814 [Dioszegia hungarica]
MSAIAGKLVMKVISKRAEQYEPPDPYYEYVTDARGKKQKQKRPVPPGLSQRDEKALKKIRKRAHRLDKGMNLCGFRVGYTFFIGIIPGAGDVVNGLLNYNLVVKPAKKLDLPSDLVTRMMFNNAISIGMGVVPLIGDVAMATWKTNSRNAGLLEAFLTIRGQEYLASIQQGTSAIPAQGEEGVSASELRKAFLPGAGQGSSAAEQGRIGQGTVLPHERPPPAVPVRR